MVVESGFLATVHVRCVCGKRMFGGIDLAAEVAREPLFLGRVLVRNVRLQVVLVTDALEAERARDRHVERGSF